MRIHDYLDPDCVMVGQASRDKETTLERMVDLVVQAGRAPDRETLMAALRQREGVVSTGIGNGIAIPHADLPDIESPHLALGVFPGGVDFDALDEEPVYAVFLLLGTPRTPGLHMKILARIARLSKDVDFASDLKQAENADQVIEALERIEARH